MSRLQYLKAKNYISNHKQLLDDDEIVRVRNLKVSFKTKAGYLRAVRGVDLTVKKGQIVGLVGESGSGKSVCVKSLMGFNDGGIVTSEIMNLNDIDLTTIKEKNWTQIRGTIISYIPQDPLMSLNPTKKIKHQIIEAIKITEKRDFNYQMNFLKKGFEKDLDSRVEKCMQNEAKDHPEMIRCYQELNELKLVFNKIKATNNNLFIELEESLKKLNNWYRLNKSVINKNLLPEDKSVINEYLLGKVYDNPITIDEVSCVSLSSIELEFNKLSKIAYESLRTNSSAISSSQFTNLTNFYKENKNDLDLVLSREFGDGIFQNFLQGQLPEKPLILGSNNVEQQEMANFTFNQLSIDFYYLAKKINDIDPNFHDYQKLITEKQMELCVLNLKIKYKYGLSKEHINKKMYSTLEYIGIKDIKQRINSYPHEFSGGMRQRIAIAMAIISKPDVIIADEPTTALDVTIQAKVLDLIKKLRDDFNISIVFISHNIALVANFCDYIYVMYAGKILEKGTTADIFADAAHPYTWALISSIPDTSSNKELSSIPLSPPNMFSPPKGDPFAPRNKYAVKIDFEHEPPLFPISKTHSAATWLRHPDAPNTSVPIDVQEKMEIAKASLALRKDR